MKFGYPILYASSVTETLTFYPNTIMLKVHNN